MGRKKVSNKCRYFLGVQEIAGMMNRINEGLHSLGIESDFFCLYEYAFANNNEYVEPAILKSYKRHTSHIRGTKKNFVKRFYYFLQMLDIFKILAYSICHYDCFLYIFGHGMFWYNLYLKNFQELEFWILKICGKKMVMWNCGSDTRAPYCDDDVFNGDKEAMYKAIAVKAKKIRMIEKYMLMIDGIPSSHLHTIPYISFQAIGIPIDDKEIVLKERKDKCSDCITLLHCPSNRKSKGTDYIRTIIKEIQNERDNIEYIEVSGKPHQEVLKKMVGADIVIDQLYSDTPMAGFATEAAINAVPVVVSGYYAEVYNDMIKTPIPPTLFCTPEELKSSILYLIDNKEVRERIGIAEKQYVLKYNQSKCVAQRILQLFEGNIIDEWIVSPEENGYMFGSGISKREVIDNVCWLIDTYGDESLHIAKNSKLYCNYMELYKEQKNM